MSDTPESDPPENAPLESDPPENGDAASSPAPTFPAPTFPTPGGPAAIVSTPAGPAATVSTRAGPAATGPTSAGPAATGPTPAETAAQVRVSYAEVDKMGVAYYANYLRWFEIGRAEYIRARGRSYKELEAEGCLLPVVEAYVRYRESAAYDDEILICTSPADIGPARLRFGYRVLRKTDGALLAEGHTVHCCMSAARRARRFPLELLQLLKRPPRK